MGQYQVVYPVIEFPMEICSGIFSAYIYIGRKLILELAHRNSWEPSYTQGVTVKKKHSSNLYTQILPTPSPRYLSSHGPWDTLVLSHYQLPSKWLEWER